MESDDGPSNVVWSSRVSCPFHVDFAFILGHQQKDKRIGLEPHISTLKNPSKHESQPYYIAFNPDVRIH